MLSLRPATSASYVRRLSSWVSSEPCSRASARSPWLRCAECSSRWIWTRGRPYRRSIECHSCPIGPFASKEGGGGQSCSGVEGGARSILSRGMN
eukprot:5169227-Prymnesium_polylepis.1